MRNALSFHNALRHLLVPLLLLPGLAFAQSAQLRVPLGHTKGIKSIQILPDGTLVSAGQNANIRFWDVASGRLINSLYTGTQSDLRTMSASGISAMVAEGIYGASKNIRFVNLLTRSLYEGEFRGDFLPHFTQDGAYYLAGQQLLPNSVFTKTPPIDLPFTADGVSPGGDFLYALRGAQFFKWRYPDLSPMPTVTLSGANPERKGWRFLGPDQQIGYQWQVTERHALHHLWDLTTGKSIGEIRLPNGFEIVAVHPSGKYVLAQDPTRWDKKICRAYTLKTGELLTDYTATIDQEQNRFSTDFVLSRDGQWVLGGGVDGTIYRFDFTTGKLDKKMRSRTPGTVSNMTVSADGKRAYFALNNGADTIHWKWENENILSKLPGRRQFNAAVPVFTAAPVRSTIPEGSEGPWSIEVTAGGSAKFVDLRIALKQGAVTVENREVHHKKSGNPWFSQVDDREPVATYDTAQIAVGTCQGPLMLFDGRGEHTVTLSGHVDQIQSMAFSPGGKKLLSASADGTIRLWDVEAGKELASLILIDSTDWVVIGPNMLFDASPRAMDLIYYVVEDEGGKNEIIELSQMKNRFYDPGLLQKVLGFAKAPMRDVRGLDAVKLYPEVTTRIEEEQLHVHLRPRSGGIGRVALFADGKELEKDINPSRDTRITVDLARYSRFFSGNKTVRVQAYNEMESLRSDFISQPYVNPSAGRRGTTGDTDADDGALSKEQVLSAKMYVLCVGTSDYTEDGNTSMDLIFPNLDSEIMSRSLQEVGCELFCTNGIEITCLTTHDETPAPLLEANINWGVATKENIQRSLLEIADKAQAQDVVLVYFSGHGKTYRSNGKEQFHYLTREVSPANVGDEIATKNAVVSSEELTEWLKDIPAARQILILDACNSGQAIDDLSQGTKELNGSQIRALTQMSDRTGLYLITGSAADKVSFEAGKYGQGLLTYALLKGMAGGAIRKDEGTSFFVGVSELFDYAQKEVVKLAANINGIQQPQLNFPHRAGSFPIGIFNSETTKIHLAQEKKVFVRSNFQNNATFTDDRKLGDELEALFREEMESGPDARFIFIDVNEYPEGNRVAGRYTLGADNLITLEANLLLHGRPPIPLLSADGNPISAKSPRRLAEIIEDAIIDALE